MRFLGGSRKLKFVGKMSECDALQPPHFLFCDPCSNETYRLVDKEQIEIVAEVLSQTYLFITSQKLPYVATLPPSLPGLSRSSLELRHKRSERQASCSSVHKTYSHTCSLRHIHRVFPNQLLQIRCSLAMYCTAAIFL